MQTRNRWLWKLNSTINDSVQVSLSKCNLLGRLGWQLTNFVKRKLSDVYESESDSNDDSPNQDILIINAEYADDVFRIHLPVSLATLAVVKEEINKRCKLNLGTCKLKYLDEDEEWILMTSNAYMQGRQIPTIHRVIKGLGPHLLEL
ncbi:NIN-like protein [Tanacetum coccineum]